MSQSATRVYYGGVFEVKMETLVDPIALSASASLDQEKGGGRSMGGSKQTGVMLVVMGVLFCVVAFLAFSRGDAYWNYGPNDPFTPVLYWGRWGMVIGCPIFI